MSTSQNLLLAPAPSRRVQPPLTLTATYTVVPNAPLRDPSDPFGVHSFSPAAVTRHAARSYSPPPRKQSLMERADAFFDRCEAELTLFAIVAVTLFVAALIAVFLPWVLPVAVFSLVVAVVALCCERSWVPCIWALAVFILCAVAFGSDSMLRFLDRVDELLCSWTTYRVIAGIGLLGLVCIPIGMVLAAVSPETIEKTPAPDPRGYGRYAIDDFVEKNTYGDAQRASKGELHLALSRRGNEELRFTPKFYE